MSSHSSSLFLDLGPLSNLPVLVVRLGGVALDAMELPAGSAAKLRGAFGDALFDLACVHRERNRRCQGCPVEADCVYPLLFEPRRRDPDPFLHGFGDPPRPWLVRSEAGDALVHGDGGRVKSGEPVEWRVTLIGKQEIMNGVG